MFTESILMIHQPFLFEDLETVEAAPKKSVAGAKVVSKLNSLRRKLSPSEKEFDSYLARAAREIKSVAALDNERQVNLILTCLETCSHAWDEIQDDSHLPMATVRRILDDLEAQGLVFTRKRYTHGGSAKQTLVYSKRKKCSCW